MNIILQLIYSILVGIVQGVSEWLPISSKTQVLIASHYLLNLTVSEAYSFGLFMEIGTTFAAIIYFRKEILILIKVLRMQGTELEKDLFKFVFIATLLTGIVAVPLYLIADSIPNIAIGIPMIIIGLVLVGDAGFIYYSRNISGQTKKLKTFKDLTIIDYIIIGIVQGIAALPGVSRSGITTSTMLIMDVEPEEAFRLSFLIGIFASIGAFGVTILFSKSNIAVALNALGPLGLLIAIITATIISLFLIDFLIKIASKKEIVYLVLALGIIAIFFGIVILIYFSFA